MSTILAEYTFGDILARYVQPQGTKRCELLLLPASKLGQVKEARTTIQGRPEIEGLPGKFKPIVADSANSLVQIKLLEDETGGGFSAGVTMVESGTMDGLEFENQTSRTHGDLVVIETTLRDSSARFRCIHRLSHASGDRGLRASTLFINESESTLSLELLTSFALNGLTPFVSGNATSNLTFHRFRSWWSLEGRTDSVSLESLHLERSWGGFGLFSERFGQVGTMPVRRWFPCAALEDKTEGVVWAAQIAWAGSWQMEVVRKGDRVTLCGGLADREFGHWIKRIPAGKSFASPDALLTVVEGNLDSATQALVSLQRDALKNGPKVEADLPVCFNEWCTSWGNPSHENVLSIARRLQGSGVQYIVIDDGWAQRPPQAMIQNNGDWIVDEQKFPGKLKPTCEALRDMGYIPGIWFEFEVVNPGAKAWSETSHMLRRDGRPLQVGTRRFWDFTDPWVLDYLTTKVIHLVRDNRIGYLKVDYNDNIGVGCDHPDSFGEGLRQHVAGVQRFFRLLRQEIPELVIENCSSGGHRLESSMQALTSMGSFSDAHEPIIIPIIARNLQRLILPQQSLVWAVLHPQDDASRLTYSLAATFLGRMCLSGEIHDLNNEQMDILRRATRLYRQAHTVIDDGTSTFYGTEENSYVDPRGWQAVVRQGAHQTLIVIHGFNLETSEEISLPTGPLDLRIVGTLSPSFIKATLENGRFQISLPPGCHGGAWLISN